MGLVTQLMEYGRAQSWVRAIGTEGSRNDPQARSDAWQDIDMTYFTTDVTQFDFEDWCQTFGKPLMCQHLVGQNLFNSEGHQWDVHLVQLGGLARIDLKIAPISVMRTYLAADSLNTINWSRNSVALTRQPDNHTHWVGTPDQAQFDAALNEFYWCAGNVVKCLARRQVMAANEINNRNVRPELLRLLAWNAAIPLKGRFDPGSEYRYLGARLPRVIQRQIMATYQQGDLVASRQSLQTELMAIQWCQTQLVDALDLTLPDFVVPSRRQLRQWLKIDI
ncbi:aminoglycoside 6-adenylyltransferase [Lactiplantibacillus modestisalitolerans]|uniref:Aminoglycoside 6-adenylyltransferase n=1 Tax=Lactiplantibacillus modestisalitolerans TaxID=1457219 RepID=A0ABV5WSP7_9LACO|nr:aminoglycoside 6-adenylyltransferase [Lactiplantibacillus modestisalitolerans]